MKTKSGIMGSYKEYVDYKLPIVKKRYIDEYIRQHPMWEAVEYLIKKNVEIGRGAFHYDSHWLNHHANMTSFWKMVELNPDVEYWKKVIDFIFTDDLRIKYKATLLKYVLEAAREYTPNPIKIDDYTRDILEFDPFNYN